MSAATILFGAACVGTLWFARKDDTRLILALGLFYAWMVANLAYHVDALAIAAVVDTLLALLASRLDYRRVADEIIALAAVRVALHLGLVAGLPFEPFAIAYNLTFAAMLGAVASNGGIIDGARDCLRALRHRGGGDRGGTFRVRAEA